MIPLSSAISSGLTWSKLPRSRGYQLTRNGEIVGSLQRSGFWSSKYLAETQSGQWTFRRAGCFGTGAQILDSTSQQPIATFKSKWGSGGALTFADGQTFHLQSKGWWRPVWSVISQSDETLLRLHVREKTVEVPAGAVMPDGRLALLILFTRYRVLQAEEDAASAATVAVIAAS
jgi:hypothetical protein